MFRPPLPPWLPKPLHISQIRSYVSTKGTVDLTFTAQIPENGNATDGALVILHGLFGSKRNWRSLSKAFHRATNRPVYSLDLRNHGASPHAKPMTYTAMARDVNKFITDKGLQNVALLGHSMGGKVAMALALSNSQKPTTPLSHLVVVDIAPVNDALSPDFVRYITAMESVNDMPHTIKTHDDADKVLKGYEEDLTIRQFLLTNLAIPKGHAKLVPHFTLPLPLLRDSIPDLGSFPYSPEAGLTTWDGKTLVIKGSKSSYINTHNVSSFITLFPHMRLEELHTGHWVHAEAPNEFCRLLASFLDE